MPISSPSTPRPASRRGRRRSSTTPTDTSSPRRPWSSRARSSSASPGPVRWARAASSRPSTPTPGRASKRWYSIPAAGERGSETWAADTWKIGGGAVWHTGTYDPATNLLYVGTGNPAPWIADMRKGDNLYTMSAVALDVDTGKMKWFHQYLANEPWDYDTVAEHHVIDVVRNGQTQKAVVTANKLGYVYTLDRITGKFLSAVPFVKSLNWGAPDPVTGKGVETPGLRPTMGGPPVEG